jgi:predicted nuclease of restriction endonuclease-like (RecB) superfamily
LCRCLSTFVFGVHDASKQYVRLKCDALSHELVKMSEIDKNNRLFSSVREIIEAAQERVFRQTNIVLLRMYWHIGKLIVEDEQEGKARAGYGKKVLIDLSHQLTLEFGKGFDESNLRNMRTFFRAFAKWDAVRTELSWTHYRLLSRVEDVEKRMQYVDMAVGGNWSTRVLQRNISSMYLERVIENPKSEFEKKWNGQFKDPYILEFLGLEASKKHLEKSIETAIIDHLQKFLMELGKGFAFVARQQHIVTDTSDFFIDLVFYNFHLKCFVLIDLKIEQLKHEHIGQMDMYVRMYNDLKKSDDDNPTIGLILCTEKDETIVKYSVLSENNQLLASQYRLYLPKEEELKALIEADRVKYDLEDE